MILYRIINSNEKWQLIYKTNFTQLNCVTYNM